MRGEINWLHLFPPATPSSGNCGPVSLLPVRYCRHRRENICPVALQWAACGTSSLQEARQVGTASTTAHLPGSSSAGQHGDAWCLANWGRIVSQATPPAMVADRGCIWIAWVASGWVHLGALFSFPFPLSLRCCYRVANVRHAL